MVKSVIDSSIFLVQEIIGFQKLDILLKARDIIDEW